MSLYLSVLPHVSVPLPILCSCLCPVSVQCRSYYPSCVPVCVLCVPCLSVAVGIPVSVLCSVCPLSMSARLHVVSHVPVSVPLSTPCICVPCPYIHAVFSSMCHVPVSVSCPARAVAVRTSVPLSQCPSVPVSRPAARAVAVSTSVAVSLRVPSACPGARVLTPLPRASVCPSRCPRPRSTPTGRQPRVGGSRGWDGGYLIPPVPRMKVTGASRT